MKKFLKWFAILLLAIITLFIAVVVALPFLIDPNDFKDDITTAVQKHTGRVLTIEGDIRLSVFPWLGLQLGKTRLSNAAGFGQQAMLKLDNIKLGVKLLPLLRQELQTDQTTLEGLQLNLQRKPSGQSNWDDLTGQTTTDKQPSPQAKGATSAAPLAAFAIGGLELRNARISWDDQQAKQHWQISHLDLATGAIQWGKAFPLKVSCSARAKHLQARSEIKLVAEITLQQDQRIELQDLKLAQQVWQPQLPKSPLVLQTHLASMKANLVRQTLKLEKLQLQNDALVIKANVSIDQFADAPQYKATLDIPAFSPRAWLKAHNIALAKDLPKAAFTNLTGRLALTGDTHSTNVDKLDIQLDNSHLTGKASLPSLAPLKYRYQLALDQLDADAYQAPSAKQQSAATPAAGAAAATQLPLDLLRHLDINGQLNIGQLKASNLRLKQIITQLNAAKGKIRLHPLKAQLYEGTYTGDLQLNAQGKQPQLSINENLRNVALGPLLKDFMGDDKLHGTTHLQARLTTHGANITQMRKYLNGDVTANMQDGYLKGVDIDYAERKLRAQFKREPIPPKPAKPRTGFSKLIAAFEVKNGIAHTRTLTAQLPHARMKGTGTLDLVKEFLNMTLNFKFSSKVQGQAGKAYDELDRVALPVHLRGPFRQPNYDIDFDAALKAILKNKLERKKAEEKARYEQKIQEEKQKLKEKLEHKADELLKKLFQR